jgi:branched-subunit amino acid transport protein AzlD
VAAVLPASVLGGQLDGRRAARLLIPYSVTGLDFPLTAPFTVLALDAVRDLRGDVPTPVLAVLSALAARLLFPSQLLLAAFTLFTATLLARHLPTPGSPAVPDTGYTVAAVLVAAAVTWALRALPFAAPLRDSATVQYLSTRMPAGVMLILVVYCLHDLPVTEARAAAPLAALAVTAGLHLWRRNALLSILGGTATHVTLASTVFAHREGHRRDQCKPTRSAGREFGTPSRCRSASYRTAKSA